MSGASSAMDPGTSIHRELRRRMRIGGGIGFAVGLLLPLAFGLFRLKVPLWLSLPGVAVVVVTDRQTGERYVCRDADPWVALVRAAEAAGFDFED